MRAINRVQRSLDGQLGFLHARRRKALWRCVTGLMMGGRLWLSALGRSLPGRTSDKHRIKAADRFVGNEAIHRDLCLIYAAMAHWLIRAASRVTISVDWTGVGPRHYALTAAICHSGRAIPVLSRVFTRKDVGKPRIYRRFLAELSTIVPKTCKPILVTDAAFRVPWLDAVAEVGWDFVARIRNPTKMWLDGQCRHLSDIHARAGDQARSLGKVELRAMNPREYRVILANKPRIKGRKRKTRSGTIGQRTDDAKQSKAAREPWVLATSLPAKPRRIVGIYRLRMQIEQTFRDHKNRRNGWALSDVRSSCRKRIEVLLLCAAIADLGLQIVGLAAEQVGEHRGYQANSISSRRVLSLFALGLLTLQRRRFFEAQLHQAAARQLHQSISDAGSA